MTDDATSEATLLERASVGDDVALDELFSRYDEKLRRMVQLRMNRRLSGRVDAIDVLQDAYVEIARELPRYLADPTLPFFLWMRHIVSQKIITVHRHHLGAKKRDAARDVNMNAWGSPSATSAAIAAQLLGKLTSPSQSVIRVETKRRVQDALDQLSELDREILVMRHFEQLNNKETAQALGIRPSAASSRYVRALDHLQLLLGN